MVTGRVALLFDKRLLARMTHGRRVVLVSGTNGKTTTSALVRAGWGPGVAGNESGSNMTAGLVGSLAQHHLDRIVLEVDEAYLAKILEDTNADVVVLLNLSRDQLDRASEVRMLAERWREALAGTSATVVANAADPLVAHAVARVDSVVWCDVSTPWRHDAVACPSCTAPLTFSDLGWSCSCGLRQPVATWRQERDELSGPMASIQLGMGIPGAFNRANAAIAIAALVEIGVDPSVALSRIAQVTDVAGRFSHRTLLGQNVTLALAKNPAGFAALLDEVESTTGPLWIAINARVADGLDPSWLYDAPFERLRGRTVFCFGDRRLDLATRLEMAGVNAVVVTDKAPAAHDGRIWALANYTAFAEWLRESRG